MFTLLPFYFFGTGVFGWLTILMIFNWLND